MGDDLGDEWWLDNSNVAETPSRSKDEAEESLKVSKKASKSSTNKASTTRAPPAKRKAEEDPVSQNKTKKKRRKKQKISEYVSKGNIKAATVKDVIQKLEQHFKQKLSSFELEDLQIDESHFFPPNSFSLPLASYLEAAVPRWSQDLEAKRPKHFKTCLLLLVTSSARRAVDLNREAAAFKGKSCVSTKLFSKHLKIEDQANFLAKNRTQFAVGTPNRLLSLLQQDALSLEGTRYVILDWNWRDVKYKTMCDIPEIRTDLFRLFEKFVIPQAKTGKRLKIGIF